MASAPVSSRENSSMEEHLTCSICMDTFEDPVTTDCGHSFCKKCLNLSYEHTEKVCPICKKPLGRTPDVNIVLRDIVQQQKLKKTEEEDEDIYTGEDEKVPFDIYTEPKLKAEESCLVCPAPYCETHLQNNCSTERLKGHKLVAPVKNLDDRACCCDHFLVEDPEEVVSTKDKQEKKKSLHLCQVCGWSNTTTYQGLRIHQGRKGCTPKGVRIPETEQCNWQKLEEMEMKVDQRRSQPAERLTFKEENLPPSRNICTNSAAATATINEGYDSTFATSQCSSLRTTKSKSANQQQYFSTLPKVNKKLPISPPPVVRPKPQIADRRDMKDNQRATAGTIKVEPISPFATSQCSSLRTTKSKSAHQQQYFSTLPKVNKKLPISPPPVVRPKPQIADRRAMKDNQRATAVTITKEPKPSPQLPFQRATRSKSAHQQQYFSTLPQVKKELPIAPPPIVRPKPQIADRRDMKDNQRATAGTIKVEPISPVAIPPRPFQRPANPQSGHQLQDLFGVQGGQERLQLELQQKIHIRNQRMSNIRPEDRVYENLPDPTSTSSQTNTAAPAAETTAEEDPRSNCETAESDFSTGMKVKELAWMFSATATQEAAVQPKEKHRGKQTPSQAKSLALRFSAATAQEIAVHPEERDKEGPKLSQTVPDSSTDQANNAASAEATRKEDPISLGETAESDFSTGMKVRELARMFSATTTQETAGRPQGKHREKQTPSQAKLLALRFSATTAQRPAVQGMEKELEDQKLSQKMPDSTGATNKMNPAAAEATTAEDAQSSLDTAQLLDFSTGVKVKELARMFSATTTQNTTVRPKEKH